MSATILPDTETYAEAQRIAEALFFTPEGRRDPHPLFHDLRRLAPIFPSRNPHAWLLTRYEDCRTVLRDPRFEKRFAESLDARAPGWRDDSAYLGISQMLLMQDPPQHTRLRKSIARPFQVKRIQEYRPLVEEQVTTLLDGFAASGGDLLHEVAYKLPITIVAGMLGIPQADVDAFRQPALDLTAALDPGASRERRDAANAATDWLVSYFEELIGQRRARPADDIITLLVGDDGPDPLSTSEVVYMAMLLLIAGFETTTNTITAGVLALHDQPDQFALLRERPQLEDIDEEVLRFASAASLASRVAAEDVEISGVTIPAGDLVFPILGAANHDPEVYPDPDRIDFERGGAKHLSFGGGIHACVGFALARLETDVLFRQLAERFETIELVGDRPRYRDTLALRAPESMPVKLTLRSRRIGQDAAGFNGARGGDDAAWRRAYRQDLEALPPDVAPAELAARVRLLENQPFFGGCRPSEFVALAATAYVLTFEAGEHLITQDDEPTDAFLIVEGTADVLIGGQHVATVTIDDFVGERGIVTETPRAADVVATGHLAAYVLSRDRLADVMERNPAAAATMRAVTAARYPRA